LLGILIFKGLTAWRLYKSFGVKGLITNKRRKAYQVGVDSLIHLKNFPIWNSNWKIPKHETYDVPDTEYLVVYSTTLHQTDLILFNQMGNEDKWSNLKGFGKNEY
jgi:hypothetical protein